MSAPVIPSVLFADFEAQVPSLSGQIIAITGTTSGTGFVAARTVAAKGATVLLLNRQSSRAEKSLADLQKAVPDARFVPVECDLQDFESVKRAAAQIKGEFNELHCLCNNAGIMATPDRATKDGYDEQMQTNHLSHFLLTKELFPLLDKAAESAGEARIVNHSSEARKGPKLDAKYFGKNGGNLGGDRVPTFGIFSGPRFARYHQTKLANSVFTYALADKLTARGSKVKALCAHPGGSATNLADGLPMGFLGRFVFGTLGPRLFQSGEDGTIGILKCMTDPSVQTAQFYGPNGSGMSGKIKGPAVLIPPHKNEVDQASKDMLWRTSEEAIGSKWEL